MLTSLVKMVGKLRGDPGAFGLITGVGMMMSNHVFAVYCSEPPSPGVQAVDPQALQAGIDAIAQRTIEEGYSGPATVAAYTVMYDRDGRASHGVAICDLPHGARAYARILDGDLLAEAVGMEFVGRCVVMRQTRGVGELLPAAAGKTRASTSEQGVDRNCTPHHAGQLAG
jgi:acetyl-CoA C-acetyltransferase